MPPAQHIARIRLGDAEYRVLVRPAPRGRMIKLVAGIPNASLPELRDEAEYLQAPENRRVLDRFLIGCTIKV